MKNKIENSYWIELIAFDKDNINAIPIIPIEPANAVKIVLPFFVIKLFKLNDKAVINDIAVCFIV